VCDRIERSRRGNTNSYPPEVRVLIFFFFFFSFSLFCSFFESLLTLILLLQGSALAPNFRLEVGNYIVKSQYSHISQNAGRIFQ
jgi:hypothetical protein